MNERTEITSALERSCESCGGHEDRWPKTRREKHTSERRKAPRSLRWVFESRGRGAVRHTHTYTADSTRKRRRSKRLQLSNRHQWLLI